MIKNGLVRIAFSVALALSLFSCAKNGIDYPDKVQPDSPGEPKVDVDMTTEQMGQAMFIPGNAIVKFTLEEAERIEAGLSDPVQNVAAELGLKSMERLFPDAGEYEPRTRKEGLHTYYLIEFDPEVSLSKAQKLLESLENVEEFERCNVMKLDQTNDPYWSNMWEYTSPNYSIHAEEAWQYCIGKPEVVVCIVDQGVQLDHEDLEWNCGPVHRNFVKNNTTIVGGEHGCHVAGTIAAVGNNAKGLVGIAGGDYAAGQHGVTLMSAQVFQGNSSASNFATAIKWGADNGALISQNSWGNNYDWNNDGQLTGQELDYALSDRISSSMAAAIDYFRKYAGCDNDGEQKPDSPMKGGVVVFAAGNDGIVNGVPSNYDPNIAVGATNKNGRLSYFSNYGSWVDICAPGESTFSCYNGGQYGSMSGTSMACPHVSGACALLVSMFGGPGFTNEDLEEILMEGTTSGLINCSGKDMGPYLNLQGSMEYGVDKYKRQHNTDPEITTDYEGDFVFRQYQKISIPFRITDADGDKLTIKTELSGRGEFVQDENDSEVWNFVLFGELVSDFTEQTAKITASDIYGGVAEYEFRYRVLRNNAPKATRDLGDVIIIGVGGQATVNIANLFTDEDGEDLSISVKNLYESTGSVSVAGDVLTIKSTAYGNSTVTVTAADALKEKASVKFNYLVRPTDVEMDFYPNPVKDILHVRTGLVEQETRIVIENAAGSTVYDETVMCSAFHPAEVDMKNYAPAVYTLRVEFGGKSYVNNVAKR